jgi:hypothetical protein
VHRSGITATGLSTDSLCGTCCDVAQDTAATLRRLVLSYQRNGLEKSLLLLFVLLQRFWPFRKSENALRSTIASSNA